MISLRRHVLTLVAVFLALAVGVILGSTSVATSIRDAVVAREDTMAARLDSAEEDLAAQRLATDRLDAMAGVFAPAVLDGILDERPVLVVVAPGASGEDVDAAVDTITAAGGVVAPKGTLPPKGDASQLPTVLQERVDVVGTPDELTELLSQIAGRFAR